MGSQKYLLLNMLLIIFSFLLLHPQIYSVNAAYEAVTGFCNQRKTSADRAFCMKVLKSRPQSASAKDNPTLLKISLDLTIGHATNTIDYMLNLSNNNSTNSDLKRVLKACISAYDKAINYFQGIAQELEDDPPMAAWDARIGATELNCCGHALKSLKTPFQPISSRHKVTLDYSRLSKEIAEYI